jgi:hypothetical protein
MFDKPVINVGYNPPSVPTSQLDYVRYYRFDHYRPVVESGAVKVAKSPDAMRAMIQQALENSSADARMRRILLKQFFGETLDGNAGQRAANVLLQLATRSRNCGP